MNNTEGDTSVTVSTIKAYGGLNSTYTQVANISTTTIGGFGQSATTGTFTNSTGNNNIGIIITSLIFGILHFQIDNLLSIIFASLLLGYIYNYSHNIFLTILLHFGFNSFSLIFMQTIKWNIFTESQLDLLGNYFFIPAGIILSITVKSKKIFWKKRTISLD